MSKAKKVETGKAPEATFTLNGEMVKASEVVNFLEGKKQIAEKAPQVEVQFEVQGIENIEAIYLDPKFLKAVKRITAQKVFRVQIGAGRHYMNEGRKVFTSLTTFLSRTMPKNKILETWREKKIEELGSVQAATEFVQATADYGTGLHIAVAEFCRTGVVNWKDFEVFAFDYLMGMGLKEGTLLSAVEELTRDFASMVAFIHEYQVEILAVELPVFSSNGYATLIDLVVEMNVCNYSEKTAQEDRKRFKAGINLKSGKKGFFEEHIFQLVGERNAFNETYSKSCGFEIEEVFNLAPTNWRKAPTFKIARQTKAIAEGKYDRTFDLYVELGKVTGVLSTPTKNFAVFQGETKFGGSPDANVRLMNYDEYTAFKMSGGVLPEVTE